MVYFWCGHRMVHLWRGQRIVYCSVDSQRMVHLWCGQQMFSLWCGQRMVHFSLVVWPANGSLVVFVVHLWCGQRMVDLWCAQRLFYLFITKPCVFLYALQQVYSNEARTENAEKWKKQCRLNFLAMPLLALLWFLFFSRVTLFGYLYDKFAGKIDGHTRLFCKTNEREIDCVVEYIANNTSPKGCKLNYDNNSYELCGMWYLCNPHICKSKIM